MKISPQTFNDILAQVADGSSLTKALLSVKINIRDFFEAIDADEKWANEYARAREQRGEACAGRIDRYQDMLEQKKIDSATARVLIDTEKWKAAKFYPKMYGDRVEQVHSGSVNVLPAITVKDGNKEKPISFDVGGDDGNTSA